MPPTLLRADDITLQLAEARTTGFSAPGWVFELKFDGFRLLAERIDGKARLVLRRGREATREFPEITQAIASVPGPDFIVDGELVIQDAEGNPIFQRLLKRSTLTTPRDIDAGMRADPAVYFAFDLLMYDGLDLRSLPLLERKARLFEIFPRLERAMPVEHVEEQGLALLEVVKARGLEGVMAKRADAPYRGGRGETWLKIALKHVWDFAIVGWADDWGALYLATWDNEQFVYAGKVGSGFTCGASQRWCARFVTRTGLRGSRCASPPSCAFAPTSCRRSARRHARVWPRSRTPSRRQTRRRRPSRTPPRSSSLTMG
jgi:bifunctional non-homologous end joining protein LigD